MNQKHVRYAIWCRHLAGTLLRAGTSPASVTCACTRYSTKPEEIRGLALAGGGRGLRFDRSAVGGLLGCRGCL